MKTVKIIMICFVLIILVFSFFKCSSAGVSGSTQTDGTTSGALDLSTIPSGSEFLKEQSE